MWREKKWRKKKMRLVHNCAIATKMRNQNRASCAIFSQFNLKQMYNTVLKNAKQDNMTTAVSCKDLIETGIYST